MILGNDTLCVKICIGNVDLESVPLTVLCNLIFADDDFYIFADFKKLIVATLVYLIFRNASALVGFFQPSNASITVVCILFRTFVGIAYYKSLSIFTLIVVVSIVYFLLRENPLLYVCILAPDTSSENVLVTNFLQQRDIVLVHQT